MKSYESFLRKKQEIENLSKMDYSAVSQTVKDEILNVDNFTKWLANDYTGYGGGKGAPGIVGRTDKLSSGMITDYFAAKGVECTERETYDFMNQIRKEWME